MEQAKKMIENFNKASKQAANLLDNLFTDDMLKGMTEEQRAQVMELKKDSKILSSNNMEKKKEIIKKYN